MKGPRLIALSLLGCVLFTYPVLSLFNIDERVVHVPLLYVFVFAAWMGLIALMALVVERRDRRGPPSVRS